MSVRFQRWVLPVCSSLLLWVTVPFVRPISAWLRARGILGGVTVVLPAMLLLGFLRVWKTRYGTYSTPRLLALLAILGVYAFSMTAYIVAPEERMHFLVVSLLTYLYHRALRADGRSILWQTAGAAGIAGWVGCMEEIIQKWIPSRQFDWRDIFMSVLAAALAGLAIRFVLIGKTNQPVLSDQSGSSDVSSEPLT